MTSHGIHSIDTGFHRPGFDAAYLVIEGGRGAFIDCGTNHSLPRLLDALAQAGLGNADVDWLILTHVHLDHAGGAGALMAALPNARLLVHARGARHMIDPTQLIAGATAVYGEAEMQRSYGQLLPIDAARVVAATDGQSVDLAGRALVCIDTPGHARHHHSIWDERSRTFFSGDSFGLSYRELDSAKGAFVIPTTSPVQFEPEAMHASIERMLAHSPDSVHLTHFGRVGEPRRLADDLHAQIEAMMAIAQRHAAAPQRHEAIRADLAALYGERALQHGCSLPPERVNELLAIDIELNAQGLGVWLDRAARN